MFRNIEKDVITKCSQIDNTVVDGYFTTQELYELSAQAGEQTLESIKRFKNEREEEIRRRNKSLENMEEDSFEKTTSKLRNMKNNIKDKVDFIDEKNKLNKKIEKEKKNIGKIQKQLQEERIRQEAILSNTVDIGTADSRNMKENIEIAKSMINN